jgi:ubiquitin-protein ligase
MYAYMDDPNEKDPAQLEAFELHVKDRTAYRLDMCTLLYVTLNGYMY